MTQAYQDVAVESVEKLYTTTGSHKEGLTIPEAEKRFSERPKEKATRLPTWAPVLLRQFRSAFVYLLFGASGISFFLGEWVDASLILVFLLINTVLGFTQEYRAERALGSLNTLLVRKTTVRRDGKLFEIETPQVVVGDIEQALRLIERRGFTAEILAAVRSERDVVRRRSEPRAASAEQPSTVCEVWLAALAA